ncbi:MAG: hypothetical protein ACRD9R_07595 [Pyrinomonadaceae bacterium]
MKRLALCQVATLSLLLAALTSGAQTLVSTPAVNNPEADPPPNVAVLKFSWSKERLGWERDPFGGPVENFDEMRVRTRNERRIDDAKRGGSNDVDRVKREARADAAILAERRKQRPPRYGFLYKLAIQNGGAKAITALDWDHVFYEPGTNTETGRQQFTGEAKVGPGKRKEFTVFSPAPPAHTISVHELNKGERASVGERIVIIRVQYADGSVWQRP